MARYLIDLTLKNQFISRQPYLKSQHRDAIDGIPGAVEQMLEEGLLIEIDIEESGTWLCSSSEFRKWKGEIPNPSAGGSEEQDEIRILSPFDGLVIQRPWFRQFFDAEYQLCGLSLRASVQAQPFRR